MLQLATAAVFIFDECEDTELVQYHVAIFDVLRLDTLLRKRIPRARSRGQVAGGFQNGEEHSLCIHICQNLLMQGVLSSEPPLDEGR